uniref:NADH-ubiquinone oxidoreductase chain 2 n=1 Tax=Pnyxia scabiei TaxID=1781627 RepID=A0A7L9R598_9DIPT|nr:NADH dehydrogenase subunit 2 [Pnyxia scabiei]QOL10540.1 NADH dehydrogenase subunit 2 [Pnyxia scabiei]
MFYYMTKILFFFLLMLGTLISVSSNSWLGIWMGLEINLMAFIPLMMNPNNLVNSESNLNYFLIQTFASMFMLMTLLINLLLMKMMCINLLMNNTMMMKIIIMLPLLLKLGMSPFHFWLPIIMMKLNWYNSMILVTWQKLAPMMIISYLISMNSLTITIILFSIFTGAIMGLNQTSLQKILAYSSINHMGWMLSAMMFNKTMWNYYFLIYSLLNISLMFMFNLMKIFYLNQIYYWMSNYLTKIYFMSMLLSLGGMPPLLGFLPKWLIIQVFMIMKFNLLIMSMILMSLITLYFYLKISLSSFMMNYNEMNYLTNNNLNIFLFSTIISMTFFSLFTLNFLILMFFM